MRTLLAVSGGIDSMCMADMYCRAGRDFAVAHCNFHLRGADSDADAQFVEEWARAHGVRFFRADFDTVSHASERGISIEMAARELRYAWFAQIAAEHGFDAVAVAHNANDNAETLILNLLRGTGLRGITGMSPDSPLCPKAEPGTVTSFGHFPKVEPENTTSFGNFPKDDGVRLVRPMLGMTRAEIEGYALEHGIEYREDRTNAENEAQRNRIRNMVFPEFAKINPSFVRTLNSDMEHFAQARAIAEDYFREAESQILSEDGTIDVDKLLEFKHWKYVLFRLAEPLGFSEKTLDTAVALIEERSEGRGGTFSGKRFYSPTHVMETSAASITLRKRTEDRQGDSLTVNGPGTYTFRGRTVRIEMLDGLAGVSLKQPAGTLICDATALPFPFRLRGWQPGDWMRPFGMGGRAKKLSDLFADNKLSLSDKESAVVVDSPAIDGKHDGHVAAVAGLRMDEALRVAEGSGKIIRITIL